MLLLVPGIICALPSTSDGRFIGNWASTDPAPKSHSSICLLDYLWQQLLQVGFPWKRILRCRMACTWVTGSDLGIDTCRREGRETGLGRGTSCAALQFQRTQLTLPWALKPVWHFRVVPSYIYVVKNLTLSKEKFCLCLQLLWCHLEAPEMPHLIQVSLFT